MLGDLLFLVLVLASFAAVGAPACLLLSAERIRHRFVLSSPIGFGVIGICLLPAYLYGIAPRLALIGLVSVAGLFLAAQAILRRRQFTPPSLEQAWLAAALVAAILLALSPIWTGGQQFTVFQGNVYDQFDAFLVGSTSYRSTDYAALVAAKEVLQPNPVFSRALWWLSHRGTISLVHAGLSDLAAVDTILSNYPFRAALQINMYLVVFFILTNAFQTTARLAAILATALCVGFFEQYVIDINAWSHLAVAPLFVLLVGISALALEDGRFGDHGLPAYFRLAGFIAVLLSAIFYLYPECLPIFGTLACAVIVMALVFSHAPNRWRLAAAWCAGGISAVVIAFPFWERTVAFGVDQIGKYSSYDLDWWRYFQRYLLGRETDYLAVLLNRSSESWRSLVDAAFSLPVESALSAIGLYHVLPTDNWFAVLSIGWKVVLYAFGGLLIFGVSSTAAAVVVQARETAAGRMIAAAVLACAAPVILLLAGHFWMAGKGLAMIGPLLFMLLAVPLICPRQARPLAIAASSLFVAGHVSLGLLRPVYAATPTGAMLAGFPSAAAQVESQKADINWNVTWWKAQLRGCNRIALDIDHPFASKLAAIVVTDVRANWMSVRPIGVGEGPRTYQPFDADTADCVVTTHLIEAPPGQRLIWLSTDASMIDFVGGRLAAVEIGVAQRAGVVTSGLFDVEPRPGGALRWASADGQFEIPNSPAHPATSVALTFWSMPLSAGARVSVEVNGVTLKDDVEPAGTVEIPLERFKAAARLQLHVRTSTVTRYPNDTRELGVALKSVLLRREGP